MEGTVTGKGLNKNQKMTVGIDGKIYYPGRLDTSDLKVGDRISFNAVSFGEKGNMWGLQSWKLLEGANKYPPSTQPQTPIAAPSPSQAVSGGIMDAERPCISNWGAELIKAGLIKDPADLGIWVTAAKNALRS